MTEEEYLKHFEEEQHRKEITGELYEERGEANEEGFIGPTEKEMKWFEEFKTPEWVNEAVKSVKEEPGLIEPEKIPRWGRARDAYFEKIANAHNKAMVANYEKEYVIE